MRMREWNKEEFPKIDVIIPVYRPDEKLMLLLKALKKQTIQPNKIIIMHTISEQKLMIDKQDKNIEVHYLKKEEYDHGGTRNEAAKLSNSPFLLFMTQDAIPKDCYLIEEMMQPFRDGEIAIVYARQIAHKTAGAIEKYTRVFNYPKEDQKKAKKDLEQLGIKTYFCSNVCAAYRHGVYDKLGGFVTKTIFNEDMIMAATAIHSGYAIYYAAKAKVVHSHHYTYRQQFSRNFDLAVSQKQYSEIFQEVKSESEGIRLVKNTVYYLISIKKWHLIPDLILQSGFKYLGFLLGSHYERFPIGLVKKLSMNKYYWK